ncbi:MAG: site-specific integrase [Phycisphaerae bacterium]|nr:site-specific integrase [Phycisphaerae bacterium]
MDFHLDVSKFLTEQEVAAVLRDGDRRAKRSPLTAQQLIIFRLATGAGLRASTIAGLRLIDLHLDSDPPLIRIPNGIAKRRRNGPGKRRKPTLVPLAWSESTLLALRAWKAQRLAGGATPADLVVCSSSGRPLDRRHVRDKFRALLRGTRDADGAPVFPAERLQGLTTHTGRHTFASLALKAGHTLAEVSQALGHSSTAVTAVYLHADPEGFARRGELLGAALQTEPKPTPSGA